MNGIILLVIILLLVMFLTLLITRQWGGLLLFPPGPAIRCSDNREITPALRAVVPQKQRFPWFLQNKLNFLGNNGKMKGEQF